MKEYYKIGEISNLYNIGNDSLRYYEKLGILSPKRDKNGYRVYSLRDIWKLNVIKDLRKLNFSMKKIKSYLDDRDLNTTKGLLEEEIILIEEKIENLLKDKENIRKRIETLNEGIINQNIDSIGVKHIKIRKTLLIEENVSKDEEIDFLLKKLNKNHEDKLYLVGNNSIGSIISLENAENKMYNTYSSVFIELDEDDKEYDFLIPEGEYVYVRYRGDYSKNKIFIPKILDFVKEKGYSLDSNIIEICKIDIHETSIREEFLTELQVKVKKEG